MKKKILFPLAALLLTFAAAGCESDSYSPLVKYTVRTDPLVLSKDLGDERVYPDRPGIFPILSAKDLQDPLDPMYPQRETLFKTNKLRDPALISKQDRARINAQLYELFGTPGNPKVVQINSEIKEALKLDDESLARGSSLYRIQCLHCHGVTGDGRGPTARWVNPHPRDYRQGVFKFMSVDQTGGPKPPRREDLVRVLHEGVEGTAMPAFNALLSMQDLENLASYVIHLSLRGKCEYDAMVSGFDYDSATNKLTVKDPAENPPLEELMGKLFENNARIWFESQAKDKAIPVAPYTIDDSDMSKLKVSVQRGFNLFRGQGVDKPKFDEGTISKEDAKSANCISCHTDFGRKALYKWDEWGTLTRPRDLTQGVYRGGRRPVDIYLRIHSGISGSGMTSFGKTIPKTEYIWDLVNFVRVMPYPAMRKSMGVNID